MKHILQSEIWQEFEKSEGEEVFFCQGEGFKARGVVKKTPVGNYLYAKYGPELDARGDLRPALEALKQVAAEKQAFFVRVEPTLVFSDEEMKKMGCWKSKEIDPAHTWVLDLTPSEEEIGAGIEKEKMRLWRNYAKKGMVIRKTKNPEEVGILVKLLDGVGERDHFTPQEEAHLKRQMEAGFATLYVVEIEDGESAGGAAGENCEKNGEKCENGAENGRENAKNSPEGAKKVPIAAALVYDWDGVRYYAHAATDDNYRRLRAGAILTTETIFDAKRAGARLYDFWGMTTSEDPAHPWYGFTQYKKSFGGRQVDYTGTYDLVIDKNKYKLYKTLRKINLLRRKSLK